ncbi:WD40 repeat domain-containing protein [Janthinobacterium sp. FW305-128]|uniref:WD40 repeat domain-containing protein n=1 Tax=Janthinobacterium sp. FW305-128 TaxID=2775055 RepID=UPI001E408437|nr:hypothetical protein [Janthinobacterium sp. FW305-128]MCC7682048.1 hypothetical protein [Janthinobacterium sp. FW305-128]
MTLTRMPLKLGCSYGVRFSPDGTRLAVLGRDLVLWDVAARQKLWRGKFIAHMSGMAFSPDGNRLAIKSTTGQLAVVDAEAGQLLVNLQNKKDGEGCGPAWSPCGQYLADGGWDGRLRVRDAQTGEVRFMQEHPGEMLRGVYAIDGGRRLLVLHGVKSVDEGQEQPPDYCSVWDWPLQAGGGRKVLSLPGLKSCAPSPDGASLAVLHHAGGEEVLSVYALPMAAGWPRCLWRRAAARATPCAGFPTAARWDASARASCCCMAGPGSASWRRKNLRIPARWTFCLARHCPPSAHGNPAC